MLVRPAPVRPTRTLVWRMSWICSRKVRAAKSTTLKFTVGQRLLASSTMASWLRSLRRPLRSIIVTFVTEIWSFSLLCLRASMERKR
jgi:hypothetical protein